MIQYFLLGIGFSILIYPVVSSLTELIMSWLDILKAKAQLKLAEINLKIEKDTAEYGTCAIGFHVPTEGEYEDEDE